ncbi:hypothetical protein SCOCK_80059 [Actinacidiphila cocklensis]|uniref:Uncharacterized protein n=1 Tax=Actinacidiphila cocklensis TaxID=887465 RepID=A0A9W4DZW0_9ACTN|nr:hypothetical protein SCOCK_80059 [Actinacidiphila cocklensis]
MQRFADNSLLWSGPLTGCLFQQLNPCVPETALSEVLSVVRVMGLRAPPPPPQVSPKQADSTAAVTRSVTAARGALGSPVEA